MHIVRPLSHMCKISEDGFCKAHGLGGGGVGWHVW